MLHPDVIRLHERVTRYVEGAGELAPIVRDLLFLRSCPPQYVLDSEGRRVGVAIWGSSGPLTRTTATITPTEAP